MRPLINEKPTIKTANPDQNLGSNTIRHNVNPQNSTPEMQSRPPIKDLPEELENHLLFRLVSGEAPTKSSQSLGRLGLSCTQWSLRVRNYITSADGKALRHNVEVERFRKIHQMSPVDAYRNSTSSSHTIHTKFSSADECITELETSTDPVHLQLPLGTQWLTQEMHNALAKRVNKLTILDFSGLTKASLDEMITVIRQVPRGGFVALDITAFDNLSENDANKLFVAIAAHPVVCHLTLSANNSLKGDGDACTWLAGLEKHHACIESVKIDVMTFETNNAERLATEIKKLTQIRELEIAEKEAFSECIGIIFKAVRGRNESTTTHLTLHYSATNYEQLLGITDDSNFSPSNGIKIRQPGESWTIEPKAFPMLEESSEEDESSEVSDYSSEDKSFSGFGSDSDVSSDGSDESDNE